MIEDANCMTTAKAAKANAESAIADALSKLVRKTEPTGMAVDIVIESTGGQVRVAYVRIKCEF